MARKEEWRKHFIMHVVLRSTKQRCTLSCNELLYEVVRQNTEYKSVLIDMYESIVDPYIKESIIYVLVNYLQDDEEILSFFKNLIIGETYLLQEVLKE